MSALPIREAVIARLSELSDEEIAEVLEFVNTIQSQHNEAEEGENSGNPLIGFFSAEPDFAARSKETLRREFGIRKSQDSNDE